MHLSLDTLPELGPALPASVGAVDWKACCHALHQVALKPDQPCPPTGGAKLTMGGPAAVVNFSKNSGSAILAK